MADTARPARRANRMLGLALAAVGLGLYLSIQLVWAAKGW